MSPGPFQGHNRGVREGACCLTLCVEETANPIGGRLVADDGREFTFTGWIALVHALEAAIATSAAEGPPGRR